MRHESLIVVASLVWLLATAQAAEPGLQIERTDVRVARGEYLLRSVMECMSCHSERDGGAYGYPPKPGREFAGGFIFRQLGAAAVSPNITPFALSNWTDQQVYDALTDGVRPDGRQLHVEMPYGVFRAFESEELYAIIAYLRVLAPIDGGPYPFETSVDLDRPWLSANSLPRPADDASAVERGTYLVELGGCRGCHRGAADSRLADQPFVGGSAFRLPGVGIIRAANITPDAKTGIGAWSAETFVTRFQAMRDAGATRVADHSPNTVMPWWLYSNMTAEDLMAIYAFLRTVAPVENAVVRYEPLPGTKRRVINWSENAPPHSAAP